MALSRGLAVLRCFDATRPQLGTTDIAQLTRLPQPTVWRLCHTLQQLGYLIQAPHSDKLRVGMAVLGLGQFALGSGDIGELALPELVQIAQLTGAAVSLGVVDQDDILIVKRAQGGGHLVVNLAVGSRLPIATSSAGWAYLASLPEAVRSDTLARLRRYWPRSLGELQQAVETAIARLPHDGFVCAKGFFHPDVIGVGAAARGRDGKVQYVVNCGGPSLDAAYMKSEIGPRIARLAVRISDALARAES